MSDPQRFNDLRARLRERLRAAQLQRRRPQLLELGGLTIGLVLILAVLRSDPAPAADPAAGITSTALTNTWPTITPPLAELGTPLPSPPGVADPTPTIPGCGEARVAGTEGSGVLVRANPTTAAGIVDRAPEGSYLVILCAEERRVDGHRWLSVQRPGGQPGWASAEYLRALR